jgi:hypothetical protein
MFRERDLQIDTGVCDDLCVTGVEGAVILTVTVVERCIDADGADHVGMPPALRAIETITHEHGNGIEQLRTGPGRSFASSCAASRQSFSRALAFDEPGGRPRGFGGSSVTVDISAPQVNGAAYISSVAKCHSTITINRRRQECPREQEIYRRT